MTGKNKSYGYVRVDPKDPTVSLKGILEAGVDEDNIFVEERELYSDEHRDLDDLIDEVKEGDKIYVPSLDHIHGDINYILDIIDRLLKKAVSIHILHEEFDFYPKSEKSAYLYKTITTLAKWYKGRTRKKENSLKPGRAIKWTNSQINQFKELYESNHSYKEIGKIMGYHTSIIWRQAEKLYKTRRKPIHLKKNELDLPTGPGAKLKEEDFKKIVQLHTEGHKISKMAEMLNVNERTLNSYITKLIKRGEIQPRIKYLHGNRKLNDVQVEKIKNWYKEGINNPTMADKLGVSISTIKFYLRNLRLKGDLPKEIRSSSQIVRKYVRGMKIEFSEEQIKQFKELYEKNTSYLIIAKSMGIAASTAFKLGKKIYNHPRTKKKGRPNFSNSEDIEKLKKFYHAGLPVQEISRQLNVHIKTIYRHINDLIKKGEISPYVRSYNISENEKKEQ